MIDRIIDFVKKAGADAWLLKETKESTAELFFVKKALDMQRMKDIGSCTLNVYRDAEKEGQKLRGSAMVVLFPDSDDESMEKAISEACDAAQYAMNPWFPVYGAGQQEKVSMESTLADVSLADAALKMTEALFKADVREDAYINSAEIFVTRKDVRILSSEGTDVGYVKYGVEGEFVTQCTEKADVEQHYQYSYGDLSAEALTEKVAEGLETVRDRSFASDMPKAGVYDVILSGNNLATVLDFYGSRGIASMIYAKYSNWEVGKKVQGENIEGEKLCMELLPDAPFSDEGVPMKERTFIQDGVLQCIHGPVSYSYYLGLEPLGGYRRVRLNNGTVPFDEMKKGCLYPVSFSDFQMDEMSGHFAGEIRLAYLFAEDGVKILTGGSINGSIFDCQEHLTFSKETYVQADYEGPLAVKLPGVNVAGC